MSRHSNEKRQNEARPDSERSGRSNGIHQVKPNRATPFEPKEDRRQMDRGIEVLAIIE